MQAVEVDERSEESRHLNVGGLDDRDDEVLERGNTWCLVGCLCIGERSGPMGSMRRRGERTGGGARGEVRGRSGGGLIVYRNDEGGLLS